MDCACAVLVDPDDPAVVYQGRSPGENDQADNWINGMVFKSTDAGAAWQQLDSDQLAGGRPFLMMLPGGNALTRTMFAAIFISRNSGAGFSQEMMELTHTRLWFVLFHPSDPNRIFVGTGGGGLFVGTGVTE